MARLMDTAITEKDLSEYLDKCSDFSFELQVLRLLRSEGFECEHGGPYKDPTTGKTREFDIRATRTLPKWRLRVAVECKNLRSNYRLIVCCTPRREEEAFLDAIVSEALARGNPATTGRLHTRVPRVLYQARQPVGRSCDQVGRKSEHELSFGDSDVYSKWSQALCSADDLVLQGWNDRDPIAYSLVLAFLVVPDGRLWTAEYDAEGSLIKTPRQVERCSYFVNRPYRHSALNKLFISHLEFLTVRGLRELVRELSPGGAADFELAKAVGNKLSKQCSH